MKKPNGSQGPDAQTIADALKRKGGKLELDPDTNGYELMVNGVKQGYFKVNPTDGEQTFLWTSASTAWPSDFEMSPPSGSLPSVSSVELYEHAKFSTATSMVNVATCQYRLEQGGSTVGYLHRRSNGLDWYALPAALSGDYFPATTMSFKSHTDSGNMSLLHIDDKAI